MSKHFSVLQNPICLKIVFLLKEQDLYVYEIAKKINTRTSKVSKYLKQLRLIGMVSYKQENNLRRYYIARKDILDLIYKHGQLIKRTDTDK